MLKKYACSLLVLAMVFACSVPAGANQIEELRAFFKEAIMRSRETVKADPYNTKKRLELAGLLLAYGSNVPKISESITLYGAAYEESIIAYNLAMQDMEKTAVEALALASTALTTTMQVEPNHAETLERAREVLAKMRIIERLEPDMVPVKGMLASTIATYTGDPEEREAMFDEAQDALRAGSASRRGVDSRITDYYLAESLAREASFSPDRSRKIQLYREAQDLLSEPGDSSNRGVEAQFVMSSNTVNLLQARDAASPQERDALLDRIVPVTQRLWGEGGMTMIYAAQAEAVRGNAQAVAELLARFRDQVPEGERYRLTSLVKNNIFFDNVRNDPAFIKVFASLPQEE